MIEYKVAILIEDVPSEPDIRVGDAFLPSGMEIQPGGYEYEVWSRLSDRGVFKTRIEHHDKFEWHTVTGDTELDIRERVHELERSHRG